MKGSFSLLEGFAREALVGVGMAELAESDVWGRGY